MRTITFLFTIAFLLICLFTGQHAIGQDTTRQLKDTSIFNQTLHPLTVTGSKPFLQIRAGKIILNVAESPLAAGANVPAMIAHMPGVNELQWHGRTLLVLIDGRVVGLKGDDLKAILDGMPAGTVDRIELIEHPSAKYDASGGAVLNIITLKNKKQGFNGTFTTGIGAGRYLKWNEGATVNYQTGKLNLYAGYDLLHGKPFYDYYSDRTVDSAHHIKDFTSGAKKTDNHSFRAGFDYAFNGHNSGGVLVRGMYNLKKTGTVTRSELTDVASRTAIDSTVDMQGHSTYFIPSMNAWFKHSFDSVGREMAINLDYLRYDKKWDEDFGVLRDHSPAHNRIFSASVDFVYPTKLGRFDLGWKSSFTKTDNDVLWQTLDGDSWMVDKGLTNHFIYRENINAAYMAFSRHWNKLVLDLGVRAEQTCSEGYSVTLDQQNRTNYISFFPNLGLQYTMGGDQELDFSYRRGIERFGFDIVNPFVRYISQYSYSQGNPTIRPSTSQNFSVSYSWKGALTASVSYQHFLDAPGTIYVKADTGNAVINTETNLGSADQFETDVTWSKAFFGGKWTTNNSVGLLYAKYDMDNTAGVMNGGGTTDPRGITNAKTIGAGRWTAMLNTDNVFVLGKGWKLQVSGMYFSPFLLGVYSFTSRFSADLGISKTVLHERGKLSLNVTDVFNSFVNRFTVASLGVLSANRQKNESQTVKLVFTYKFGGMGNKNAAARRSGIEDLKQRLGGN